MTSSDSAHDSNPYRSPEALADRRARLGWLVMLVILWPIVMALAGSILGFFAGRLSFNNVDPAVWNPGIGAATGAALFAIAGFYIGFRKARYLRGRLDEIHARREEIRQSTSSQQAADLSEQTQSNDRPKNNFPISTALTARYLAASPSSRGNTKEVIFRSPLS